MPKYTFKKPRLMRWNTNAISDHNRSPLEIGHERIESSKRMVNGTMRKYVVADKKTFNVSWEDIPHSTTKTVDGYWGGKAMEDFYLATRGSFTLELTNGDGTIETYTVVFTDFNKTVKKRGTYDFWDVNVSMEEV